MSAPNPRPAPDPADIKSIAFTEFTTVNDTTYKRRRGTQEWFLVEEAPPPCPSPASHDTCPGTEDIMRKDFFTLYLLRQNQYPHEPLHWSLIISLADGFLVPRAKLLSCFHSRRVYCTYVFQVLGDMNMKYELDRLSQPVELFDFVHSIYVLGTLNWDGLKQVQGLAEKEEPPRAEVWKDRTESSQHWVVRVVRKLVDAGMVENSKVEMMEEMLQPL